MYHYEFYVISGCEYLWKAAKTIAAASRYAYCIVLSSWARFIGSLRSDGESLTIEVA